MVLSRIDLDAVPHCASNLLLQIGASIAGPVVSSLGHRRLPIPVTSLVDKSLVVYEEREGEARYRLLETMRQYGRDRLAESGESDTVWRRHRDYFLALSEEAEPKLTNSEQAEWLQRLKAEHENLRAVLDWSVSDEGSAEEALRLSGALSQFWCLRGHLSEGRKWCDRALSKTGDQARMQERKKALNGAGGLAWMQGDYAAARAYLKESLTIKREIKDQWGIAHSLEAFASLAAKESDTERAAALWGAAEALREEIGAPLSPTDREQYNSLP